MGLETACVKQALRAIHGKYETIFFTLAALTPHFVIVQVDRISLSTVAIPVALFLY